jgi:Rod binding domain-containing protein
MSVASRSAVVGDVVDERLAVRDSEGDLGEVGVADDLAEQLVRLRASRRPSSAGTCRRSASA